MTGLSEILKAERDNSARDVMSRYGAHSVRELIEAYNNRVRYVYLDYEVRRIGPVLTITNQKGRGAESTKINLESTKITGAQRQQAMERIWDDTKAFLQAHYEDIKSGRIKAADIGGAVYASTATIILIIFAPFAALGPLGKVVTAPFVWAAAQKGRYWGAAVDEVVRILKGENDLTRKEVAGVLATIVITAYYLPGVGAPVELLGTDAWNLTVEVGKKIGGAAEDAVDQIVSVVGPIGEGFVDVAGQVIDAIFGG